MAELAWRLGLTPEDLEHTIVQPTSLLPSLYNRSDLSEMNREQMIRQVQLLDVDTIKLPRGTAVPYIPATMDGQPIGYMVPAWSLRAMHQNIYPVQQIRNQVSLGALPTLLLSPVAELRHQSWTAQLTRMARAAALKKFAYKLAVLSIEEQKALLSGSLVKALMTEVGLVHEQEPWQKMQGVSTSENRAGPLQRVKSRTPGSGAWPRTQALCFVGLLGACDVDRLPVLTELSTRAKGGHIVHCKRPSEWTLSNSY